MRYAIAPNPLDTSPLPPQPHSVSRESLPDSSSSNLPRDDLPLNSIPIILYPAPFSPWLHLVVLPGIDSSSTATVTQPEALLCSWTHDSAVFEADVEGSAACDGNGAEGGGTGEEARDVGHCQVVAVTRQCLANCIFLGLACSATLWVCPCR